MRFVPNPRGLCRRFEVRTSPEALRCSPPVSHGLPTIGGATTDRSMRVDYESARVELRLQAQRGLASSGGFGNSPQLSRS